MCFPVWEPALNALDGSRVDLRRDICYFTVVSRFARGNKAIVCSTYTLRPSELIGRSPRTGDARRPVEICRPPTPSPSVESGMSTSSPSLPLNHSEVLSNETPMSVSCYRLCEVSPSPANSNFSLISPVSPRIQVRSVQVTGSWNFFTSSYAFSYSFFIVPFLSFHGCMTVCALPACGGVVAAARSDEFVRRRWYFNVRAGGFCHL